MTKPYQRTLPDGTSVTVHPTGTHHSDAMTRALIRAATHSLLRDGIVAVRDGRIIPPEEFYKLAGEDK